LKPFLVLALIFLVGAVTGSALTLAFRPHLRPPGADQMKDHLLTHLTHRLNLTSDQQAKIDPIISDVVKQMETVHREEVGRMSKIIETMNQQVTPILTPEQQAELQKMEVDDRRKFFGHDRPRGPHDHPDQQTPSAGPTPAP
jgi:Spy/CpxP family protein refolding chaperone